MESILNFYINQLSPKRAAIYSKSWCAVGYIIYKYTWGSCEGRGIWHEFSEQDVKMYNKDLCDAKWESFKKLNYIFNIQKIVDFIYEDGGSTYNPNHEQLVENEEVKNFVYDVLLPKLSIKRMRNMNDLRNLSSALYHMSSGKDRDVLDDVCKMIKNVYLRTRFVFYWDATYFAQYGLNNIINWVNIDELEKPNPKPCSIIEHYTHGDLKWVEKTKNQLKSLDDYGFKPPYLKGYLGNRAKKLYKLRKLA